MREDGIEAEEEGEEKALNATDTSPIPPSSMDSSKVFQAVKTFRKSRTVSLIVVSLALLLDYMLITVVVPILPNLDYFERMERKALNHSRIAGNATAGQGHHDHMSDMGEESFELGILLASKSFLQLLCAPFVGAICNRFGFNPPILVGLIILFVSTVIFGFAESYAVLFAARSVQGIGSSLASIGGMGLLAVRFQEDEARGKAMGVALGCTGIGALMGAPIGGVMYQFIGRASPFLLLAGINLITCLLHIFTADFKLRQTSTQKSPVRELLGDPYIWVCAGALCIPCIALGIEEATLPLWMKTEFKAEEWQQGIIFFPSTIAYLVCTNLFGVIAPRFERWFCGALSLLVVAVGHVTLPLATRWEWLIPAVVASGAGMGITDGALMPVMGQLVDLRHGSVYGGVYAIADVAICLGYSIGPIFGGSIVATAGFQWTCVISALIQIIYAPFIAFLRDPPPKRKFEGPLPIELEPRGLLRPLTDQPPTSTHQSDESHERAL